MITVNTSLQFFDKTPVIKAMDAATRKSLSRIGAFVRTSARSSIRSQRKPKNKAYVETPSAPGSAPKSRTGKLKNRLFFVYDHAARTVVIGPEKFNGRSLFNGIVQSGTVPQLLESGGTSGVREIQTAAGGWIPQGRKQPRPGQAKRTRQTVYAARPYMAPALAKNLPKIPEQWRNQVA